MRYTYAYCAVATLMGCVPTAPQQTTPTAVSPEAPVEALEGCGLNEAECDADEACFPKWGTRIRERDGRWCKETATYLGCSLDGERACLDAIRTACDLQGQPAMFGDSCIPDGWGPCTIDTEGMDDAPACDPPDPAVVEAQARRDQIEGLDRAYLHTAGQYSKGLAPAYFSAYADELSCFFGKKSYTIEQLRKAREPAFGQAELMPWKTIVLQKDPDEVTLLSYGAHYRIHSEDKIPRRVRPHVAVSDQAIDQGTHAKIVVMSLQGEAWKITAETNRAGLDCVDSTLLDGIVPPAEFVRCQTQHDSALKTCDAACSGPTPGNTCNACPEQAFCGLTDCLGLRAPLYLECP